MDLVELSSKSTASADYFDAKFEEIAAEIKGLQGLLGEHQEQVMLAQNTQARIKTHSSVLSTLFIMIMANNSMSTTLRN